LTAIDAAIFFYSLPSIREKQIEEMNISIKSSGTENEKKSLISFSNLE